MFYQKLVFINREEHANLKLDPITDYLFAATADSVPVAGVEFSELAREMPVVFAVSPDGSAMPVALMALRDGENLFVTESGAWDGRYVPAFIRRYPFALADNGTGRYALCYDEAHTGFGTEAGEPLFKADGELAERLAGTLDFLENVRVHFDETHEFTKWLVENQLLVPTDAKVTLRSNNQEFRLAGFHVVDSEKFGQLSGEALESAFRKGFIGWVFAHYQSLGNLDALGTRLSMRMEQDVKKAPPAVH
ncbi:SapC family protein [Parachitinimonas caeni]|uniref:SapC family protein n=1 Tax=Parachitinimonas caeni TaxID=3031301 RepID=A0ABT7DTB8_9NEIS|nr:SapC family protein [Parachitinimonas caeni]MDK2123331.1 SapC family protein [Parachitinimonas caeni]